MHEIVVKMNHIHKRFPGVYALNDVSFELRKGEVHALLGENGAGKSTLMKILTGVHQKDSGQILYKGKEVSFARPRDAMQVGIGIVYQELNNMPHLTVAQNIFVGREPKKGILLDEETERAEATKLLKSLEVDISVDAKMGDLTIAQQQMVEIAKVMSYNSEVLILDEPTSSLTQSEIEQLFAFIRRLKSEGVGIIYISHRLEELPIISDRITVMRDGQNIGTKNTTDLTTGEIIMMMVGRTVREEVKCKSAVGPNAPIVLEVKDLRARNVKNVSFKLHKGEILGMAGLVGAGRTETVRALYGADPKESGEVWINGEKVAINSPVDAVKNGIGYLSEDRKNFGLALGLEVRDNLVIANLDQYLNYGVIRDQKISECSEYYVNFLNIKTPSIRHPVKNLSGGNQQKVVVSRWLLKNSDVLIFDEPTRGIDVGAKDEMYKIIRNLAAEGKAIILISSEMPEIMAMSDRILVMYEGRINGEIPIEKASPEEIMKLATDADNHYKGRHIHEN